ncbi:MAG: phosphonate ABC transporter substrate-binding protein [Betaproteobacteria bacterium]|nr:MAG: phosphonate ABC transporter substrate-binding protein [Betaproteobacteria bacterium]
MFKKLFVALSLCAAVLPAHAQEVNFGIISTESQKNLKSSWGPLLDDMQKQTGLKVNAFFASDYNGIIEAQRFNKVQVAWYGNQSAIDAVDRAKGEVFVQTLAAGGAPGYWSMLVVHKDSPIKSIEDVKKHAKTLRLGFGDPKSTSGTLVPGYYAFQQNGIDPAADFKAVIRSNHETNLLAVATKQVDIATNNNESLERLTQTQPDRAALVREIWRSPLIASDPLVWRADLAADTKKKIKDFLVAYGKSSAEEKQILTKLGLSGFQASSDVQLVPYRQLRVISEKNKVMADTRMSDAEKKAKLAELDRQLAELGTRMAAAKQ